MVVVTLMLLAVLIGLAILWENSRRARLINIVLILHHGARYADALEAMAADAPLLTPEERRDVLRRLVALIDPHDIIDGFGVTRRISPDIEALNSEAKALWETQMQMTEIHAHLLLQSRRPHGSRRAASAARTHPAPPTAGTPPVSEHTACLLGLTATVAGGTWQAQKGQEAFCTLRRLRRASFDALYVYYQPSPGEMLTVETAERLFHSLHVSVKRLPS